jgi:hypothetical protein
MVLRSIADWLLKCISPIVTSLSFEWILTSTKRPNGGEIVFLRALLIALWVYLLAIAIKHGVDPTRTRELSFREFEIEVCGTLPVLGAILAAVYFALYARFAAQWTYLANLYNQIKEAEARTVDNGGAKPIIAAWKAGFLEDAEELHLATKRVFAPILRVWGQDAAVEACFITNTPGGKPRRVHRFG